MIKSGQDSTGHSTTETVSTQAAGGQYSTQPEPIAIGFLSLETVVRPWASRVGVYGSRHRPPPYKSRCSEPTSTNRGLKICVGIEILGALQWPHEGPEIQTFTLAPIFNTLAFSQMGNRLKAQNLPTLRHISL